MKIESAPIIPPRPDVVITLTADEAETLAFHLHRSWSMREGLNRPLSEGIALALGLPSVATAQRKLP